MMFENFGAESQGPFFDSGLNQLHGQFHEFIPYSEDPDNIIGFPPNVAPGTSFVMNNRVFVKQESMGGDEYFQDNIYTSPFLQGAMHMPSVGGQTGAQGVLPANSGSVIDPSQTQYGNKGLPGNEMMLQANAFNQAHYGGLSNQQMQSNVSYSTRLPESPGFFSNSLGIFPSFSDANPMVNSMPLGSFTASQGYNQSGTMSMNSSFSSSNSSFASPVGLASTAFLPSQVQCTTPYAGTSRIEAPSSDLSPYPETISPSALQINPSPTPASPSSESEQTDDSSDYDDSDDDSEVAAPTPPPPAQLKQSISKPRKELPSKPTQPRFLPSSSYEHAPSKSRSSGHSRRSAKIEPEENDFRLPSLKPVPEGRIGARATQHRNRPLALADDGADREAKDRFLQDARENKKMTYKEIKVVGGFTEAESTLRGRYRALTKRKEDRVRKPEWQDKDLRLLRTAVQKLSKGNKVPWKQVALYIVQHNGSYHFGNATCRKKWDELVKQGRV
ncbi:hypothetical protein F5Y16DRAFT_405392 [Xylariaceae sp. FL0255]|nr:hypothetical protein F5Y16DRAFT_405392 [Xylariaceae sp. FL0255]